MVSHLRHILERGITCIWAPYVTLTLSQPFHGQVLHMRDGCSILPLADLRPSRKYLSGLVQLYLDKNCRRDLLRNQRNKPSAPSRSHRHHQSSHTEHWSNRWDRRRRRCPSTRMHHRRGMVLHEKIQSETRTSRRRSTSSANVRCSKLLFPRAIKSWAT
jgi:hypothetical protein